MSNTNLSVVTSGNKTFAKTNIAVKFSREKGIVGYYSKNDDGTFEPCDDPIKAQKEKLDSSFDRHFRGWNQDFDGDDSNHNHIQTRTLSNFAEGRAMNFERTRISPTPLDIKSFVSDWGGIAVHIESIRGSSAPIDIPTSPSKELDEWKRKLLAEKSSETQEEGSKGREKEETVNFAISFHEKI